MTAAAVFLGAAALAWLARPRRSSRPVNLDDAWRRHARDGGFDG